MSAQTPYKLPPEAIRKVLDTAPTPSVSLSPTDDWMVLMHRLNLPPVSDLAAPMLRLAGSRLNPATNGPHGPRRVSGFTMRSAADGKETRVELPADANLSGPSWSADGKYFAFTNTLENGIELWVCEAATGKAKKLTGAELNGAGGAAVRWMPDQRSLLVKFVPAGRGKMPETPRTPDGPVVQESSGKSAPVRTYQDLLQDTHDEALFDWIMTAQLAVVSIADGARTDVGAPAIFGEAAPSPSSAYLLVSRVHRPYSFNVPWSLFPETWEVWDLSTGKVVRKLHEAGLREDIPTQGVETGPRGFEWMETQPATLLWAEALDGGDPKAKVPHRDRVMALAAPFDATANEVTKVQHRFSGLTWLAPEPGLHASRGLLSEFERERRWTRTWLVSMGTGLALESEQKLVFDRSVNDRYNDPGDPITERTSRGFTVIKQHGNFIYLRGDGASPEGDRPFLDRMSLATLEKERLWRNEGESYESVVDVTDGAGGVSGFITSYESKTSPPNLRRRDLGKEGGAPRALTEFTDPLPELRKIKKRILTYTRDDGVPLSATLYTPPDYVEGTRLPLVIWAYPNEVSDSSTAGQVAGSENRFTQLGGTSQLFLVLAGYAVMDNASMPVVGDPETVNDTFVKQIVANAKAAIGKAAELGVGDPARVAVAGHSYGAFMTANLLAHAPAGMFRAGVARSGAYNRTLTPFGFQSERRSFWEAPEVYMKLSPFAYADKIKTPLLMTHGQLDNNSGTFPIQSERLYQAIKGQGGTVRLVMLPYESHGYSARESVMHVHAETVEWLDKYVKPEGTSAPATGGGSGAR